MNEAHSEVNGEVDTFTVGGLGDGVGKTVAHATESSMCQSVRGNLEESPALNAWY